MQSGAGEEADDSEAPVDVFNHESCELQAEDGRGVCESAAWRCLARRHVVAGFGLGAAYGRLCAVGKALGAVDAFEFSAGKHARALESVAQRAGKRTTRHLAKLGGGYFRRINFQGRAHRREKCPSRRRGLVCAAQNQVGLAGESVDGVDGIVVGADVEACPVFGLIGGDEASDVGIGVDVEEAPAEHLGFFHPYGRDGGRELSVEIRHGHGVGVHYREAAYARAHKGLRTPRPHAACAEEYHRTLCHIVCHLMPGGKSGAAEDVVV